MYLRNDFTCQKICIADIDFLKIGKGMKNML